MESKDFITWEFLKNVAEALDSYRIRVLIDAKNEIINSGVYSEDQYYQILFEMFDRERMKYLLLNYIKNKPIHNFESLKTFSKKNSIDIKKTLSNIELLKNEGLIETFYPKKEINTDIVSPQGIKNRSIKALTCNPSEIKSIYEPVNVIFNSENCSGCGLCAGICPVNCINVYNGFGKIEEDKCIKCGLCYYFCPRTFLPVNLLNMEQNLNSNITFSPKIGSYLEIYSAKTKIKEISNVCQDGGITSTCLYFLLDSNQIDMALGAKMSRTLWRPEPVLIKSKGDILKTVGTKYVNNPTLSLLNELNNKHSKIAVVGVPCMMQALLKSEIYNVAIPSLSQVLYRIGIFCMESFSYESLLKICQLLNVNVNDIQKTDINKGKFFIYTKKDEELSIQVKEISHLARKDCKVCFDLTSESADISIGSTGSPVGWNTIIIRTIKGKQLFDSLIKRNLIEYKNIKEVQPGLPTVEKIANSKKNKCFKHLSEKSKGNMRIPNY
ncbi:MAG: Coenzyme F420 hydrogenase/dehydrogenase, beta subunit C-terminal domain [Promethearchaeota archaeon]